VLVHSTVVIDRTGTLRIALFEQDEPVARERWQASLAPAVGILRSMGGGSLFVPHQPGTLHD
jgi:hypothetical protein